MNVLTVHLLVQFEIFAISQAIMHVCNELKTGAYLLNFLLMGLKKMR